MRIGIVGTRGIPNNYGGFEQFAEKFSVAMVERGHDVCVYTSHNHQFKSDRFNGVEIIRCFDPEYAVGTFGQFVYDFNCIRDSRNRNFDIILQLGYTSSSIWSWLFPKSAVIVTNMDGLEWSRSKYSTLTKRFLKVAERWAVRYSDYLIADSRVIRNYLTKAYKVESLFVAYGASEYVAELNDRKLIENYSLTPGNYDVLIARFEPENNIEAVLQAYDKTNHNIVLVGNHGASEFGKRLYKQYGKQANVKFLGSIYEMATLSAIRFHSRLYLHGHSVGGTNPSLLEAMACRAVICAHDNPFNRDVLGDNAFYFKASGDLLKLLSKPISKKDGNTWIHNNLNQIKDCYNWELVTATLEKYFKQWLAEPTSTKVYRG